MVLVIVSLSELSRVVVIFNAPSPLFTVLVPVSRDVVVFAPSELDQSLTASISSMTSALKSPKASSVDEAMVSLEVGVTVPTPTLPVPASTYKAGTADVPKPALPQTWNL